MEIIRVKDLKKRYRGKIREEGLLKAIKNFFFPKYEFVEALKGISFSVREGEILGYIGPNGAGKTTTIKILSGVLYPDEGEVDVLGYFPFKRKKEFLMKIGVFFSGLSPLWYYIPAEDTFLLHKDIYGLSNEEYQERIELFDELLSLKELLKISPRKMSMGQRRRCEIALTFLHKPKVVFLDEPTVFLDVVAKEKIHNFIREIVRRDKVTVLLTTHIMGDIEKLCDRIIILDKGRIIYDGPVEKIQKLMKYKIIEIELVEKIELKKIVEEYSLVDYRHLSESRTKIKIRVPVELVKDALEELSKRGEVVDINVYPPSLEDIIKEVYEKGSVEV